MLQEIDLIENFSEVVNIDFGIFRCQHETPRLTLYYYIKIASININARDLLVVSENRVDDDFAIQILREASVPVVNKKLVTLRLPINKYEFSKMLLAPSEYHSYFRGILDDKRDNLILCLPVHDCEFSGNESAREFILMRRQVNSFLDWCRLVCPKILFRFDNQKTRGGTGGGDVFVKYETVLNEIDNLNGVEKGFLEVSNYMGEVVEILSVEMDKYVIIRDRFDERREVVSKVTLLEKLWIFLTGGRSGENQDCS